MKHIILFALGLSLAMPLHAQDATPAPADKPAGAETAPAPANPKAKPDMKAIFKRKDKDNDGFLTKEEFIGKAKDASKAENAFTRKDKDGDGKVSLDEFIGKGAKGGKGGKNNK